MIWPDIILLIGLATVLLALLTAIHIEYAVWKLGDVFKSIDRRQVREDRAREGERYFNQQLRQKLREAESEAADLRTQVKNNRRRCSRIKPVGRPAPIFEEVEVEIGETRV